MNRVHRNAARALAGVAGLAALSLFASPAVAHVIAGVRVFPVTTTFDDPGVGDELTLPQIVWQRGAGPRNDTQVQWEFDKRITPTTALIYNHGFDILSMAGAKTRTGFENVVVTGKWQAFTSAEHEFVVSVGVGREFSGGTATQGIGGDQYGATSPNLYFGKGLGDLPIGMLRPLAVTGEFSYAIPDRRLNSTASNNGSPALFSGSLSLQYSLPYLQSQVKDVGLGDFFGSMVPLVEVDYTSPTGGPAAGNPATLLIAPGVIYEGDTYQVGLSALIPGNKAAGQNVGFLLQVHFFLDDILPNSLGKPIFN
jgi:hypothetical protein